MASASVIDNLFQSADRFPDRCALQDGSISVTYAQLLRQCLAVARALRERGLANGDRVAIVLPNSFEFVAAYYGTMLAGGIAVLLNAAAKERDFTAWLSDSGARFVCCEDANTELARAMSGLDDRPVVLSASAQVEQPFGVAAATEAALTVPLHADDPACILYTSGTTGRPKGVVLSHRNLLSNSAAIVEYLHLTSADSIVTVLPFYYSYGSSILHTHLQVGARIILQKNFLYPHAVVDTLAQERATGFAGVPPTFALLLSRVKLQTYDLAALRYVTQAGGAMPAAITERLCEALPHVAVFVMYGQTEATARLTYLPPDRLRSKLGSVGIPVAGVEIEIRREGDGAPASAQEAGEIWARGPNIMLGYWRNEAATREVIRDGWLRTGDMGRLDEDGFLYIVGRRSDMIKAGAHRIHPQDIEDVISELPQVQEVAVVGVDDELLGQTIRAFVVPVPDAAITPMQVQAHCRARLANYKVPKTIELVQGLPRTSSGKIRRAALIERVNSE